jgi:hypothetical protein
MQKSRAAGRAVGCWYEDFSFPESTLNGLNVVAHSRYFSSMVIVARSKNYYDNHYHYGNSLAEV